MTPPGSAGTVVWVIGMLYAVDPPLVACAALWRVPWLVWGESAGICSLLNCTGVMRGDI